MPAENATHRPGRRATPADRGTGRLWAARYWLDVSPRTAWSVPCVPRCRPPPRPG